MAATKKAAKAGAGAVAAGKAAKSNPYVQRLIEDDDLRDNLRQAFESARKAYDRMSNGKGVGAALFDDRKTQRELKEAASNLRDAAETIRGVRRKRKRGRRTLMLLIVGGALAIALNENIRNKALDLLFGSEEEFEYQSTTSGADDSAAAGTGTTGGDSGGNTAGAASTESAGGSTEPATPPSGPAGTS